MRKVQLLSGLALCGFLLCSQPVLAEESAATQETASVQIATRRPNGRDGIDFNRAGQNGQNTPRPESGDKQNSLPPADLNAVMNGEIIGYGQSGPVVELIRSLLIELDYPVEPAGELYDRELSYQIGRFQQEFQLAEPNSEHFGRVGPLTLQALREKSAQGRFNRELGRRLAEYARSRISGGSGYCYHYVAKAVEAYMGRFLRGLHAYMAADQLASTPLFKEVSVPATRLPSLPAGAIVVWAKGKSASGHISIADGRGNEISDHVAPQMTSHYGGGGFRVFLPVGRG